MSRRQFSETLVRKEGRSDMRFRLTCGRCGVIESLGRMAFTPRTSANEQVPKKFEAKGWTVGKADDGREDLCPACTLSGQQARRRLPSAELYLVPLENAPMPSLVPVPPPPQEVPRAVPPPPSVERSLAAPPRQASRDERRIIFQELEKHYVDEATGYCAGWTDKRVAEELGVPRAWVALVRDENFGPAKNEELEALRLEAKAAYDVAVALREEVKAFNARIDKALGVHAGLLDRVAKLEKAML